MEERRETGFPDMARHDMTDRAQPGSTADPSEAEGPPVLDLDIALRLPGFSLDLQLVTSSRRVALFGASGSGKTLTLEVIAGLQRPRSGHVRVLGETFFDANTQRDLKPQERRTGYVPQDYHLFPHMSAAANVAYGLRGRQPGRSAELLELVGLADQASKRPRELSGGQRQRVAFARALAAGPRLLLLDEPFSALDDVVRSQLRRSLAELLDVVGTPSLLVTHDLLEATLLADTIVVIRDGRVEQVGSGETLMLRPANAYIADLVGMTNRLQAIVVTTEGASSWVRWGHDTLEVAAHLGPVGSPVTLGMRPERLRVIRVLEAEDQRPAGSATIDGDGHVEPNAGIGGRRAYGQSSILDAPLQTVDATVERVTLHGLERLLSVQTSAGLNLEARLAAVLEADVGALRPAPGDRVRLQLAPSDLWPLAGSGESKRGSTPDVV